MESKKFQSWLDGKIDKYILWAIPKWLKPNHFTYLRLVLVAVMLCLFTQNQLIVGFVVFFFAGLTDLIDGSLARTRDQITDLGKILDPLADKTLVLVPLLYFGFDYLIVWIITILILFEVVGNLASALLAKYIGRPPGANFMGKIKFTIQAVAVGFFLLGIILNKGPMIRFAEVMLYIAIAFGLLSAFQQVTHKLKKEA